MILPSLGVVFSLRRSVRQSHDWQNSIAFYNSFGIRLFFNWVNYLILQKSHITFIIIYSILKLILNKANISIINFIAMKKSVPYILSNEHIQGDGFWSSTYFKSFFNKNWFLPLLFMLFSVAQAIGQLSIDVGQPIKYLFKINLV